MQHILRIICILLFSSYLQLFGVAQEVCKHEGKSVYFTSSSVVTYPQYKTHMFAYAKKHIVDESFDFYACQYLISYYPEFAAPLCDEIVVRLQDISQESVQKIQDILFNYFSAAQRTKIEQAAKQKWKPLALDISQLLTDDQLPELPKLQWLLAYADSKHRGTQTEHHLCKNLASIITLLHKYKHKRKDPLVRKMLWDAFIQEVEEYKKGNYVFWHGRKWGWEFRSDIYKQLHNVTAKPTDRIDDTYIPLRFGDSYGEGFCLNYALFGNTTDETSGSLSFVLRNHDYNYGKKNNNMSKYTVQYMFGVFGLSHLYEKYRDDFIKLENIHTAANSNGYGALLVLSVKPQDIHHIYPAWAGSWGLKKREIYIDGTWPSYGNTTDTKKIIEALRNNPASLQHGQTDLIEFAMKLNSDYALNHKKGPRIFSFNAASSDKMKEYNQLRDAIFARLAKDIAAQAH